MVDLSYYAEGNVLYRWRSTPNSSGISTRFTWYDRFSFSLKIVFFSWQARYISRTPPSGLMVTQGLVTTQLHKTEVRDDTSRLGFRNVSRRGVHNRGSFNSGFRGGQTILKTIPGIFYQVPEVLAVYMSISYSRERVGINLLRCILDAATRYGTHGESWSSHAEMTYCSAVL